MCSSLRQPDLTGKSNAIVDYNIYNSGWRGEDLNKYGLLVLGIVFVVIGFMVKDQSWTRPEMFAGLQLDLGKTVTNIGVFLLFIPVINI